MAAATESDSRLDAHISSICYTQAEPVSAMSTKRKMDTIEIVLDSEPDDKDMIYVGDGPTPADIDEAPMVQRSAPKGGHCTTASISIWLYTYDIVLI